MQNKSSILIILFFISFSVNLFSQNDIANSHEIKFGYSVETNSNFNSCITSEDYRAIDKQCKENITSLGLTNIDRSQSPPTLLNWPIRAASGFYDCDFYFIGAYVDQDTNSITIMDYDCGSNTYDAHHGTDIAAWPFGFYKMDNNQVEVIAAAPGTIIQKADGNFDRNCSSNTLTANSIIIQHADGSQALYWHMKSNSLTAKIVGQTVVAGEYLGVVGSSGSSSGPHLHFEVWTGNTNTTYIDPFSGNCNTLNNSSWWNVQKPHTNPALIKVSINTTDIPLNSCPITEVNNEADTFAIPFQGAGLSPGYAKFYIFLRDDVAGMTADCKILNPNGSTFSSFTYTSAANNKSLKYGFSKLLPTIAGNYIFRATYNGITCSKNFIIIQSANVALLTTLEQLNVFNNPANGTLTISGEVKDNGSYSISLLNITGHKILYGKVAVSNKFIDNSFSTSQLASGIYFLKINNEKSQTTKKIIVQR